MQAAAVGHVAVPEVAPRLLQDVRLVDENAADAWRGVQDGRQEGSCATANVGDRARGWPSQNRYTGQRLELRLLAHLLVEHGPLLWVSRQVVPEIGTEDVPGAASPVRRVSTRACATSGGPTDAKVAHIDSGC